MNVGKPSHVTSGQTWIWHSPRKKAGEAKPIVVDKVTIPIPEDGEITVKVMCLEYKVSPDGANLVHFRGEPGKAVDKVMLTSKQWEYLRG